MTKQIRKKKSKSNSKPSYRRLTVKIDEPIEKMLKAVKDEDLENDSDAVRRLIKQEFERKNVLENA